VAENSQPLSHLSGFTPQPLSHTKVRHSATVESVRHSATVESPLWLQRSGLVNFGSCKNDDHGLCLSRRSFLCGRRALEIPHNSLRKILSTHIGASWKSCRKLPLVNLKPRRKSRQQCDDKRFLQASLTVPLRGWLTVMMRKFPTLCLRLVVV